MVYKTKNNFILGPPRPYSRISCSPKPCVNIYKKRNSHHDYIINFIMKFTNKFHNNSFFIGLFTIFISILILLFW